MTQFDDNQAWTYFHPYFADPTHVGDSKYDALVFSMVGQGPKGDQGDPMQFSDLTNSQIDQIRRGAMAAENQVLDEVVTTTATVTSIDIPFPDYSEFDVLFIDVNGLDLSEHDDYEISGSTVVLSTPVPAGQDIHFRLFRYLIPDGNRSIQVTDDRKDYDNVELMQADDSLQPGDICHTLGFHAAGDGGAAWYKVVSHAVANGMDIIALNNGCFAILQITTPYVYSKTYGSTASGDAAELYAIQFAADNSLFFWNLDNE